MAAHGDVGISYWNHGRYSDQSPSQNACHSVATLVNSCDHQSSVDIYWHPRAVTRFVASNDAGHPLGRFYRKCATVILCFRKSQWIGLRENLQESPIFHGKIYGFL